MIKKITKIGNSHGIIFDHALMDLAHLKPGDEVNVTVADGGTLMLEPMRPKIDPSAFSETVDRVLEDYSDTLRKLS
ncbi:MAG: hypothetical protein JJU00_17875 [Opitutales bacterium]|nr:hypothetical protein [Opitutales bacterium]